MELPKVFLDRMRVLVPQYEEFVKSYEKSNIKSFFVNQNNISSANFIEFCKWDISKYANGFILNEEIKVGKTIEHHSGMIYMQELSAMMPATFLPVSEGDWVLDMCSAPGGKSIQVANRLKRGIVVSNEVNRQRANILKENVERMGLRNVCITNNSPEELETCFGGVFDAVLVDAPCSGEGMFRKDENAILNWSPQHVEACSGRQMLILNSANKMLKPGGYLLYSTCTFSVEEDEMVVAKFCKKYGYDIIPLQYPNAQHGEIVEGLATDGCLRFYPHKFLGEGQFVALLRKRCEQEKFVASKVKFKCLAQCKTEYRIFEDFCKRTLNEYADVIENAIINNGVLYYVVNKAVAESGVKLVNCGVKLGEIAKNRFEPSHNFVKSFGDRFSKRLELREDVAYRYLRGEVIQSQIEGYLAITYRGVVIGLGKGAGGVVKNHYPKNLRNS